MRALEGIRVVDLSHVLAAPTATMFLADLGAEVIHVERSEGDEARAFPPFVGEPDKDRSGYFISLNRNKKSIVLNLAMEEGKEILRGLIRVSDVLVENFRPGTMRKLGFGWETLQQINPHLVYASVTGFGHDTPPEYRTRPAYDVVAQAYSGIMSITGPEGGPPCRVGTSIGDIVSGHQAAIGILAALMYREKTGRGQHYDGSMVDSLVAVLENAIVRHTVAGEIPGPLGSRHPSITPFQTFQTFDGWIVVAVGNEGLWGRFCAALGRDDLAEDPRFRTNPLRCTHAAKLIPMLSAEFLKGTSADWLRTLESAGIPCSPLHDIRDVCEDPHVAHRKMVVEIDQPGSGRMRIAGSPIRLSETPGEVYAPAPLLGQHTEEVLRRILGLSAEEIDALERKGVVRRASGDSGRHCRSSRD